MQLTQTIYMSNNEKIQGIAAVKLVKLDHARLGQLIITSLYIMQSCCSHMYSLQLYVNQ